MTYVYNAYPPSFEQIGASMEGKFDIKLIVF
jgi:hypothetical protein